MELEHFSSFSVRRVLRFGDNSDLRMPATDVNNIISTPHVTLRSEVYLQNLDSNSKSKANWRDQLHAERLPGPPTGSCMHGSYPIDALVKQQRPHSAVAGSGPTAYNWDPMRSWALGVQHMFFKTANSSTPTQMFVFHVPREQAYGLKAKGVTA